VNEELYVNEYQWLRDNSFRVVNRASKKLWHRFLIAEKTVKGGKIEIYGIFAPAHFFEIKVTDRWGRCMVFSTGSGSLDGYMDKLMPVILGFLDNIIAIKKQSHRSRKDV
jgi:hypothetical protein